jgi:xylulokinase
MADRLPAVLGLDVGTTEAKAALVGLDGRLLGLGRAGYPTDLGPGGRAEQDPRRWRTALAEAVAAMTASTAMTAMEPASAVGSVSSKGAGAPEILAICCVSQGPTLVVVDAVGEPLRPAITWQDRRAGGTGFGLLPKMAWLAREDPAVAGGATWLLPAFDAMSLWLSGEAASSLQAHETVPSAAELAGAGVQASQVPAARPFGSRLGSLTVGAAGVLGLRPGTPVISGVNDGAASMLGAGLWFAGDAVDTGGTSGGIAIYVDNPVILPVEGLYQAPAPIPGRWAVGGAMAALGASVDWLRSAVLGDRWTLEDLFAEAASVSAGAEGLVFLPYLAGERAPIFDEGARGAFVGLTLAHGRAHLVRAVLEGAAFAMRDVAEPLAAAGAPALELRLAGRSSPGDLWARIKADVLGVPAAIPAVGETAVLGAAIIAAAGIGAVPSLGEGVASMTAIARRLEPDPTTRATYDEAFGRYRALYPALRPLQRGGGRLAP